MSAPFDPDAAAAADAGIFGLPHDRDQAEVILVPAPYDATTSYRRGTAAGPEAVRDASHQVDLFDLQTGHAYRRGIHLLDDDGGLAALSAATRAAVDLATGEQGTAAERAAAIATADDAGDRVNAHVGRHTTATLADGKLPGVLGGDHSVPFAAIAAVAAAHPGVGILHVDAHADLRPAYQGLRWSHASIMHNVLDRIEGVSRIVQVGVRDLSGGEMQAIEASGDRVITHFDLAWRRRLAAGETPMALFDEAVEALPAEVYVSFDIDGLQPALCPNTGTPVPGGLDFGEACLLLERLVRAGRRIVGFDLCEVAPGPTGRELDALVGARVLYKLCGFALLSR